MWNKRFEGWYFKHQLGDDMIAFIPGRADGGAFVQVVTPAFSRQFDLPNFSAQGDCVRVGACTFSPRGCHLDLPGITGDIAYGPLAPLARDIMGPFRFLPMECRHGIISMGHALNGVLRIDGVPHPFDGGIGYIEKDSGRSFPSAYQWLQCNDFEQPCSVMASVARIPFAGFSFTGCICALNAQGRQYRLATYAGARIVAAQANGLCLSQGKWLLEMEISPAQDGHPPCSPVQGQMSGRIRESNNVGLRLHLWENGTQLFSLTSNHAAYEYVPRRCPLP